MERKKKLIRITTIPISLKILLKQQLKYMSSFYEVVAVSSPDTILNEVALQEEVRTVPISMTRAITPLRDFIALIQLYLLFKKENPLIVHTHTPKAGLLGMAAARFAKVPIRLHTVAGLPLMEQKGLKKKLLALMEKLTYGCSTKVYPNSTNLSDFIIQNKYCHADKVKVLGNGSSNGIDVDFFRLTDEICTTAKKIKERLGLTERNFVFLFVGRLVKDKGIVELISAFKQLKSVYPDIKLLLVGEYEPERDPLPGQIIEDIQTHPGIIHVGFQQDIRPYLALSNVLTFPSYREGFPNVPMQAGCFNLPSIVTNINGCNEIVEHEKNGLVIPVKNTEALRQAMECILTNQSLYLNLKANSRKLILARYDQKYFWKLLQQEYEEQVKSHETLS